MVVVPVEPAHKSKINITQAVTAASMLLVLASGGKLNLSAEEQTAIVTTIGVVGNVATWIMRTWFSKSVTPSSI